MIQPARAATVLVLLSVCAQGAAGPSATVVILPPHVKAGDAQLHAAAEMLCDRLAEKLTRAAGVRVVDRTQLRRVLAEHKQSPLPPRPILSYDAMVRVAADNSGPVPRVEVALIDLSMGNVIGSKQYAWAGRMDEKLVAAMAELCTSAARMAAGRQDGRIKVRLVSPLIGDNIVRLEPLAARLERAFGAALARSGKLRQVHHLEAASSAEESLLLLVGLSRLPGGRRFSPQADAAVRLRIAEVESAGKSFPQTVVRLEYRVDNPKPGRWQSLQGTVAQWDQLVASAWQGVAELIRQADPRAARDYLNELSVRRRQAQAEIEKLHSLNAHKDGYLGGVLRGALLKPL
ncbi:hypothetical protein LCGC14_1980980 [marine sediment metagenome]|uniref:Uncharacterized protein n=1 Tax=marine sediment metagenome TaxID=412755 RepID=A0A0F9I5Y5_9ZZZZ